MANYSTAKKLGPELCSRLQSPSLNRKYLKFSKKHKGTGQLRVRSPLPKPAKLRNVRLAIEYGRTFTYNIICWLLTASDPESGTIIYDHDANGKLISRNSPSILKVKTFAVRMYF